MIYLPKKYKKFYPNLNEEFIKLEGELEDKVAQITFAKFLRHNLGFCVELLSGFKLAHYQELMLKGWLNRNFNLCVWGRGCAKTTLAAIYCYLQCIFEPNTKILIAGPTFRTSRFIFEHIENFVKSPEATLLHEIFGVDKACSKRNDLFQWNVNGGSIVAIPLNGEKIRGFRAQILVLDEFLLLPKHIIDNVLMPFLLAPKDIKERIRIRQIEEGLIEKGIIDESNRMEFASNAKMVALSSASYTFENLFDVYKKYEENIYNEEQKDKATYAIYQIGYQVLPEYMLESTVIEMAENGGSSNASFQREYCAQFTDESSSYFSVKKMHECTIPDKEEPTAKIVGDKNKKYILSIDPNGSNSPSADNFAMSVMELDEINKQSILVHCYACAGKDFKDNMNYLYYLWRNFNIVLIMGDAAGTRNFLDGCNESELFIKEKINFKFLDWQSDKEGADYDKMLNDMRKEYNLSNHKICIEQYFSTEFIRKGNEHLQKCIDFKQIWFGSSLAGNEGEFNKMIMEFDDKTFMDTSGTNYTGYDNVSDLITNQDVLIHQTKKECALIEVKATTKGTLSFDLPQTFKRDNRPNRVRKDSYTSLMLGNWGAKCYYDIVNQPVQIVQNTFTPFVIR